MGVPTGWYDGDFNSANGVVVTPGAAIMFASQGTSEVQFAGSVAAEDLEIHTGDSGFTMIGNSLPVDVTLGEMTFANIGDADSIQFVDKDAITEAEYFYFTEEGMGVPTGWYDGDFNSANDVVIKAGAGALFSAMNGKSVTITIPSPLK